MSLAFHTFISGGVTSHIMELSSILAPTSTLEKWTHPLVWCTQNYVSQQVGRRWSWAATKTKAYNVTNISYITSGGVTSHIMELSWILVPSGTLKQWAYPLVWCTKEHVRLATNFKWTWHIGTYLKSRYCEENFSIHLAGCPRSFVQLLRHGPYLIGVRHFAPDTQSEMALANTKSPLFCTSRKTGDRSKSKIKIKIDFDFGFWTSHKERPYNTSLRSINGPKTISWS